jgi:NTE family protein
MVRAISRLLLLVLTVCMVGCGNRQKPSGEMTALMPAAEEEEPPQPVIGLALGGGGAKAAAEIGVLKWLDDTGINISSIAGTSMGAVVGGLYAAGYSVAEIEDLWLTSDWLRLFDESAVLKVGERTFFGLVRAEAFEDSLRSTLLKKGCRRMEDTPIPFRCTATQIIEDRYLDTVVLKSGDMARAIRASMTYPAPLVGYRPFVYNGKRLADGGLLNNLPVNVVRDMNVEKVIAVDLEGRQHNSGSPSLLGDIIDVVSNRLHLDVIRMDWLLRWLAEHPDADMRNRNRRDADAYIHPDLSGFSIRDFAPAQAGDMIDIGRDEARKYENKILSWY